MEVQSIYHKLPKNKFLQTWIVLGLDILVSLLASAFVLVLTAIILPQIDFSTRWILTWLGCSLAVSAIIFRVGKAYKSIIRYSTLRVVERLFLICLGKDFFLWILMALLTGLSARSGLLAGMVIIDFFVTLASLSLIRVVMIAGYDRVRSQLNLKAKRHLRRVLIYGTSSKSVAAVSQLRDSETYHIDGFITYGDTLAGHRIEGMEVYYFNNLDDLRRIIDRTEVSGILFPDVADAREEQDRLIAYCRETDTRTWIIPKIDELTPGASLSHYIRKIRIEDLLGREEIKISMNEIVDNFRGKTVMVTGAAGSIGSELCRQLASFGVARLVLFDNAETPLHNLRLELEDRFPDLDFEPVIGDVRSLPRLDYVFSKFRPETVFHAAAYKHVPLMEENPCEAIRVNVLGSRQVADKCVEYGVEKMVMVSTDKAVNPTNIMGCSKRLAEIYVQSLGLAIERGETPGRTCFVTTRFGNVLGSNGSVIPRFREQIEHGGPVTVTHPEITRFFMTIPEACRLVMEAATFATGTQIFVFDMGESVKIVTLAERMIQLAGLELGRDIKIEFTGLRPGEKLYEEVLATKENTLPTTHDRIFIAKAREYPYASAADIAAELAALAESIDIPAMVRLMKTTVPEFKSRNSRFEEYDKGYNERG